MQGHVQFAVDGHVCFIVPEGADAGRSVRIVGSVTLGERRYSICAQHLDHTRAAPSELLTARELQIAVLIAQGFANKAIGRRLGISPFTVGAHLARTYSKLGVSSRSALAARIAGTVALHRRSAEAREADQVLSRT
ncbi:MAG TPA: LuxR C-terminal-related transcriptional regulator [Steroidobacteraceae bacterium]|jgi:DNA-binding NarL/FixJ family response regulator